MLVSNFKVTRILSIRSFTSNTQSEFLNLEILTKSFRFIEGKKVWFDQRVRCVCPLELKSQIELGDDINYIFHSKVSAQSNFLKIFVHEIEVFRPKAKK